MSRAGWVLAVVCGVLLLLSVGERRRSDAVHARTADSLARVVEAAQHAHDTTKARNAEREVRDQRHADSLRRVVNNFRRNTAIVIVRADTVLVPIQDFVYVTDTLLPACEACAARLDSAVAANRIERNAASDAAHALRVRGDYYATSYARLKRRRDWQARAWPVALIGGVVLGAWVRSGGHE